MSYALGLCFLFLVAIIWTFASIIISSIFENGNFDSPFLLTYMCTSLFVVLLIPFRTIGDYCTSRVFVVVVKQEEPTEHSITVPLSASSLSLDPSTTTTIPTASPRLQSISVPTDNNNDNTQLAVVVPDNYYHYQHLRIAAMIAPVWFASNFAYNFSLKYTTISSSTVLSSTGSLFTFFFALLSKEEVFTKEKCIGVLFCMMGSILTTINDYSTLSDKDNQGDQNTMRLWGDATGLLAAVGYGFYTVLIRKTCHSKPHDSSNNNNEDGDKNMALIFGYIGACNMILLAPFAFYQFLILPNNIPSRKEFQWIVINGLLDNVLSDYLWARAVVLTSATVATVGVGLTIPLAFVSDVFIMKRKSSNELDLFSILGALGVLIGFVLVNLGNDDTPSSITDDDDDPDAMSSSTNNELLLLEALPNNREVI